MERCDALIVGGGAAGAVAALKLARAGQKTVLVERADRIGGASEPKIDITQDTGIHSIAKELGIPLAWHSAASRWFSRNSSFDLRSKVIDLFIRRGPEEDSLECTLINKAMDAGCDFRISTKVPVLKPSSSSPALVGLETRGTKSVLKADFVISADGSASKFAHSCITPPGAHRRTVFHGFGVLSECMDVEPGITHIFFDSEFAPGGYFYMCASKNGDGVAAIVVDPSAARGRHADWHFKRFVENNPIARKALKRPKSPRCFIGSCSAGKCHSHYYKNLLFVGDAGRLLDPLLGYGLNHAIRSGCYAADAIIQYGSKGTEDVAEAYEWKILAEILPELRDGERARGVFNAFSNSDFDTLVGMVHEVSKTANLDEFFDDPLGYPSEIARAVLAKPGTFLLLRHLHRLI